MQPSTKPAKPMSPSTLCPPQLVYPSDFQLTDKEVGPSPLRSRPHLGSRPSLAFLCFRKAASATCPFPTPTQVGHPASPRAGCLSGAVGRRRRREMRLPKSPCGQACTACKHRSPFRLQGDSRSPTPRQPVSPVPAERGVSGQWGLVSFTPAEGSPGAGSWPRLLSRARVSGRAGLVFRPGQATPGHTSPRPVLACPQCTRCGAVAVLLCVLSLNP